MINLQRISFAVLLFFSVPSTVMGQEPINMQKEIFVTSSQYLLIESAVLEFRKHNVDLKKYRIGLYQSGEVFVVIFEDPNVIENQRGASSKMPTFEVVLDKEGNVSRSNFSR